MASDTISTLLYKIDLIDLVEEYGVNLKLQGNAYRGRCPIHDGHNDTSFCVFDNRYFCHACGATGNAIQFYQAMEGLPFYQAVERLCDKYEVSTDDDSYLRQKNIFKDNAVAAAHYAHRVNTVMDYLTQKRGLNEDTVKEFQLGYDDGGFLGMEQSGIVIPIQDHYGRVIGFSKRRLDNGTPKYRNTKENEIFKKREILFNYHRAVKMIKSTGTLHLVEGYLDVMSAYEQGIPCVGYLGARLTQEQIKKLRELQQLHKDITFILAVDNPKIDQAGAKALVKMRESILKYAPDLNVRVAVYEDQE